MKKTTYSLVALSLLTAALAVVGLPFTANAQWSIQEGINAARGTGVPDTLFGDAGIITTVTNTMLFIVGALSVIMIIWGGIRYATSAGNAASVTAAKNTIIYAILGLVIAFLSFAAINFILGTVTSSGAAGFTNV